MMTASPDYDRSPRPTTLVEAMMYWAQKAPHRTATTFVPDHGDDQVLTYGEFDRRARAVAAALADSGATGERVLLLYPPGLDYITAFFGCLYAGAIAIPLYPPDPTRIDRTLHRLQAIVGDAEPRLALTTAPIRDLARSTLQGSPQLARIPWLATDAIDLSAAERYRQPRWESDPLAFLQYTSGSTGTPKGVMLSHANLLSNIDIIARTIAMGREDRMMSWLPPYHDMGLIGTILMPLRIGAQTVLMSPMSFLRRPRRWLEAVTRHRATVTGGPNFGYSLCVRKIPPEQRAGLDLSHVTLAFVGAEPVRASTLGAFVEAFGPHGFRSSAYMPCYGLAEATLLVSGSSERASAGSGGYRTLVVDKARYEQGEVRPVQPGASGVSLVGAGAPAVELDVRIVDPDTGRLVPPGQVGEIWVAGPSVARGYWGRKRDGEAFGAALGVVLSAAPDAAPEDPSLDASDEVSEDASDDTLDAASNEAPGAFLRTGDLGFLHEGELFICGRRKDLLIVNGRNLHPQDLEVVVENSHEQLRPGCCAVFSVDDGARERLVVVNEVTVTDHQTLRHEEIERAVQHAVATHHGLRVDELVLLPRSTIPKTSSGKIQRRACRTALLGGTLARISARIE